MSVTQLMPAPCDGFFDIDHAKDGWRLANLPYTIKIMPKRFNPLVVAIAYDGLCTFEFGVAVEMFGLPRPEMGKNWYRFAAARVDSGVLRACGGVKIQTDGRLSLLAKAGTIIIPGWRGANAPVPDALIQVLRKAHRRGARILTICSGVFVLAATGLLDGRRATTHWRYTDLLRQRFPQITVVPDVLYVDEGEVLTSAGSAAGIDLCLHLIRRDYGVKAANKVARRLVVPPHRDGGQAQFIETAVPQAHESGRLGAVMDRMRRRMKADHPLAALAKVAGMSQRTLLRRFEGATGTTPAKWLLEQRLARAKELLEVSAISIEQIAEESGFGSVGTLRHHFRRHYSTTPTAYRVMFAAPWAAEV